MPNLEKLRDIFQHDVFACQMGAVIEAVDDGYARCTLDIRPDHMNAGNAVQGGVTFTLADFTFAIAANGSGQMTVSLDNHISYIAPAKGTRLIAEAKELHTTKRIAFYEVTVTDDLGTLVAVMQVNGYRKDVPIDVD